MKNKFQVYINSADNTDGSSTKPTNLNYNLGSCWEQMPLLDLHTSKTYCYVRVAYFSMKYTATQWTSDGTSTILININVPQPSGAETKALSQGYNRNTISSNIIGVIPTGNTNNSYSNNQYDNNWVCISNIFKGSVNIQLNRQDGELITAPTSANPYEMLLEVYFDDC
jgi:hypothetical protein